MDIVFSSKLEVELLPVKAEVAACGILLEDLVSGGGLGSCTHLENLTGGILGHLDGLGIVGIDQGQAIFGHSLEQLPEGFLDGSDIGVDVGVVKLDIIQDDQFWKIVEKLAPFIGEGGVVFVSFQNPEGSFAVVASSGKVHGNASDEPTRLQAAFLQKKGQHGRGGGLSVGAGDDQISGAVKKPTSEEFGQGYKRDAVGEDSFQFGISSRKGVADDG